MVVTEGALPVAHCSSKHRHPDLSGPWWTYDESGFSTGASAQHGRAPSSAGTGAATTKLSGDERVGNSWVVMKRRESKRAHGAKDTGPALLLHWNRRGTGFGRRLTAACLFRAFLHQSIEDGNENQCDECGRGKSTEDDASHRCLNLAPFTQP